MVKNIILALMAVLVIAGFLFGLTYYRHSLRDSRTISKMEKKIARLDLKMEANNKEREALHKEVLVKSRALQSAEKTLAELRNTVQIKDREHKNSREKINGLEKSLADLNRRLAVQKDAVKSLKLQLEKKQGALAELKENRKSIGSSAAKLKKQLESSQSRLVVCLNRTETAQKNKEQLQQKITSLQEGRKQIESKLAGMRAATRELVSRLQKQIQNQQIVIKEYKEKLTVRVLDRILFESGMASITPEGKEVLRKVGEVLKGISGETIQVIGNTDSVPIAPRYRYRYASNWELSAARAATVVRFFQQKSGIDPEDMVAMGRSSYHPVANNATPAGRASNRNVEIVIKPKLNGNGESALTVP